MSEDLGNIAKNGFDTYRHNLTISIPFLLFLFLYPMVIGVFLAPFLSSGAVGMAREATLEGKTSLKTMWTEGKAHWLQVLFPYVILVICMALFAIIKRIVELQIDSLNVPMGISVGISQLFPFVLVCILPVAIVVDGLGAAQGIRSGIDFIISNKVESVLILLLYLFLTFLGFEAIMLAASPNINLAIIIPISFFQVVVLYPPFTVLWTRLYMARTGKLDEVGSETASLKSEPGSERYLT